MTEALMILVSGLFLWKGADWFVGGAARIAKGFGVSELVVGLTIVAMGTSAPELAVSATAAFKGQGAIALGNVVGRGVCLHLLEVHRVLWPPGAQLLRELRRIDDDPRATGPRRAATWIASDQGL